MRLREAGSGHPRAQGGHLPCRVDTADPSGATALNQQHLRFRRRHNLWKPGSLGWMGTCSLTASPVKVIKMSPEDTVPWALRGKKARAPLRQPQALSLLSHHC